MAVDPEKAAAEFLSALKGGIAGKRVLAAVSGGADSAALAAVLSALSSAMNFTVEALTVQHGLREDGSSEADAAFAVDFCARLAPSVPCMRVDLDRGAVAAEAERRGGGIEDAARSLRYKLLRRRASEIGADWIMTGHTENDQFETLLMRVLQGSGGGTLSGVRPVSGDLARPLLRCSKDDLTAYLARRGMSWREDSTNADPRYLRNRVRNALIPLLDADFPGWRRGISGTASRALLDDSFCRESLSFRWRRAADSVSGSRPEFEALHPALAHRALQDALNLLSVGRRIPFAFLDRIVRSGSENLVCGAGLRFERAGDSVFFGPDIVHYRKSGYLVYVDSCGVFELPFGRIAVTGTKASAFLERDFGPWQLPLVLRSRLPGDRLADGGETAGTLKKKLNEWAVPETLRDSLPLIEVNGKLRAVFGSPFGYPDHIF